MNTHRDDALLRARPRPDSRDHSRQARVDTSLYCTLSLVFVRMQFPQAPSAIVRVHVSHEQTTPVLEVDGTDLVDAERPHGSHQLLVDLGLGQAG